MQAGDSAGELSLLAARPLWYTMVTCSESVTVMSLDLHSLKEYVTTCMQPAGVAM